MKCKNVYTKNKLLKKLIELVLSFSIFFFYVFFYLMTEKMGATFLFLLCQLTYSFKKNPKSIQFTIMPWTIMQNKNTNAKHRYTSNCQVQRTHSKKMCLCDSTPKYRADPKPQNTLSCLEEGHNNYSDRYLLLFQFVGISCLGMYI